jgi:hypothetical protein
MSLFIAITLPSAPNQISPVSPSMTPSYLENMLCGTDSLMASTQLWLRFTGLNIPRNATVTAAYIQFEADKSDSGASNLTLKAELSANTAAFTTKANNITNRPLTSASVTWSPPAWTQGDRGAAQKTPDLKALVQAVVNQAS